MSTNPTINLDDSRSELWQWDTGRYLSLPDTDAKEVHISRGGMRSARVVKIQEEKAVIPDGLLVFGGRLFVYIIQANETGEMTLYDKWFDIQRRPKPDDYIYTGDEIRQWEQLEERLSNIESNGVVMSHEKLSDRDAADQHPVEAITGLKEELGNLEQNAGRQFVIQLSHDETSADGSENLTADKRYDDVYAAYRNGLTLVCRYPVKNTNIVLTLPLRGFYGKGKTLDFAESLTDCFVFSTTVGSLGGVNRLTSDSLNAGVNTLPGQYLVTVTISPEYIADDITRESNSVNLSSEDLPQTWNDPKTMVAIDKNGYLCKAESGKDFFEPNDFPFTDKDMNNLSTLSSFFDGTYNSGIGSSLTKPRTYATLTGNSLELLYNATKTISVAHETLVGKYSSGSEYYVTDGALSSRDNPKYVRTSLSVTKINQNKEYCIHKSATLFVFDASGWSEYSFGSDTSDYNGWRRFTISDSTTAIAATFKVGDAESYTAEEYREFVDKYAAIYEWAGEFIEPSALKPKKRTYFHPEIGVPDSNFSALPGWKDFRWNWVNPRSVFEGYIDTKSSRAGQFYFSKDSATRFRRFTYYIPVEEGDTFATNAKFAWTYNWDLVQLGKLEPDENHMLTIPAGVRYIALYTFSTERPIIPTLLSSGYGKDLNYDSQIEYGDCFPVFRSDTAKQGFIKHLGIEGGGSGLTAEQEAALNANTAARHTHANQSVLDSITADKLNSPLGIAGATVGQVPQVSSVDADGKPLTWVAVDMPKNNETVETWQGVRQLVRAGKAKDVFEIGDQLTCQRAGITLTWDIIGIDIDTPADERFTHSLTLQLHDCINALQYDASEALYYCETTLAAGTYNFTLPSGYDVAYGGGKTYQFTLSKEVPAGGQITFPWGNKTQASTTKASTYKSRTDTTEIETVAVAEGAEGTSLGTADGNSANMNHTHRIRYGSNNWKESALRQWLNSPNAAGSVWTPQTKFDRPPSWNASTAGFMNGLDADFLAVIGKTTKVTCRNTVTDGGGSDTTKDKFFLLSRREVFAGDEVSNVTEGEPYPFYSDYSDYTSANVGADTNRIKYRNGSASYWWLRAPSAGSGYSVRCMGTNGSLNTYGVSSSIGVAPACNVI